MRPSPDFFGVNGAYLRAYAQTGRTETLDALAASMAGQRISWARLTFDQAVEEARPGAFNWGVPDTMIAALARHGVRGAASFVGTASWAADPQSRAGCGSKAYPYLLSAWTDWVAAAARRYGEQGTFWSAHPELPKLPIQTWEIGNEVNSALFWCPGANPEQYAKVYAASAAAINRVDSSAQVIVAGLAPRFGAQSTGNLDVPSFLSRLTAADPSLRSTIPEVAIHPYAPSAAGSLRVVARFRQAMRGAGLAQTPMLANEVGWYTRGAAGPLLSSEAARSQQLSTVAGTFWRLDCGVTGLAPYSWITLERDPSDSEQWYGLADAATGAPHPSGLAYGQQIREALGGNARSSRLRTCGRSRMCFARYRRNKRKRHGMHRKRVRRACAARKARKSAKRRRAAA